MGLEVSAAGNHEFDRGLRRLRRPDPGPRRLGVHRGQRRGAGRSAGRARRDVDQDHRRRETVGFVGAVTEDLPALVNPDGIQGVTVTDVVDATNAAATDLKAGGADLVVLLVHEGSPSTSARSPTLHRRRDDVGQHRPEHLGRRGRDHLRPHAPGLQLPVHGGRTGPTAGVRSPSVRWSRPASTAPTSTSWCSSTTRPPTPLAAISQDVIATAGVGYAPDPRSRASSTTRSSYAETAGAEVLGKMSGQFKRASLPRVRQRHREPWWRVDAEQPGRRGPALVDRGRHRVHEPGRPARRHGGHGQRRASAT